MDNKQDRQFYWQVKDFLQKTPKVPAKKSSPLKNTIRSVMNSPHNINSQLNEIANKEIINASGNIKNQVADVLSTQQNKINAQKPKSIAHAKTITTNIFKMFGR